jgi:hypothetical protein
MLLPPRAWISKEQEPSLVVNIHRRVHGASAPMPKLYMANTVDDVRRALDDIPQGPVVLDSASALGMHEALVATALLADWARRREDRVLAIFQANSAGEMAGLREAEHLVDAVVSVGPDPWGVRKFTIQKCRFGPLQEVYFRFGEGGVIEAPGFQEAAYSIEGSPGSYYFHPYPLGGAKWAGVAAALASRGALEPGMTSAGVVAPYLPNYFLEPLDREERRRFAEANDLTWISAAEAVERAGGIEALRELDLGA